MIVMTRGKVPTSISDDQFSRSGPTTLRDGHAGAAAACVLQVAFWADRRTTLAA